jgi:hypothetical protein
MLDEVLANDFVDRSLIPGQGPSREQYKQWATVAYAASSFADFTIEDQIARGNMVITTARFTVVDLPGGTRHARNSPGHLGS